MTKRILLVENEKNLARLIDVELQKAGYVVDLVEQGEMAGHITFLVLMFQS